MSKKPTLQQRNAAKAEQLLKQSVTTSTGFLRNEYKKFIVDEMVHAANNKKKSLKGTESVQDRYDKYKVLYEKLFNTGLKGHGLFPNQIERNYKKDIDKGTVYYIREKGREREVSLNELMYKMELLSHTLSAQQDVAFTKFKPIHYLLGKGSHKIVIEIPDLRDVDFDEITVQDAYDYFEDHNIEVIDSDPGKIKGKDAKEKWLKSKKRRQTNISNAKKKYYKLWRKEITQSKKKRKKK